MNSTKQNKPSISDGSQSASALLPTRHANRSRRLIKCAKDSGHYQCSGAAVESVKKWAAVRPYQSFRWPKHVCEFYHFNADGPLHIAAGNDPMGQIANGIRYRKTAIRIRARQCDGHQPAVLPNFSPKQFKLLGEQIYHRTIWRAPYHDAMCSASLPD